MKHRQNRSQDRSRDRSPKDALLARALRTFAPPPFMLGPPLRHAVQNLARRHPELFDRLGEHCTKDYLIDPIDMPLVLRLSPRRVAPRLDAFRRDATPSCDATIAGPLNKLLALIQSDEDGDALFFSRELTFEGDTEAVVALRNAIDDAELDLAEEFEALFGLMRYPLRHVRHRASDLAAALKKTRARFQRPSNPGRPA